MCSEIPVIRATAGGICSPSGSAINDACACVIVVAEDAGPADLEEMPSRSRGCGLAVDHQCKRLLGRRLAGPLRSGAESADRDVVSVRIPE